MGDIMILFKLQLTIRSLPKTKKIKKFSIRY
nr:MAG TPA: hypothetical protein [Caudoviricetes sp.]